MFGSLNEILGKWEPVWLFLILFTETWVGAITLYWIIKEYAYDENKDLEKKQRRTKTTKKTTTKPGGESVVEEMIETVEPTNEDKKA